MITIIFGVPRVGKTALMTSFALERMTGKNAVKAVRNSCKRIKKFNEGGYNFTYPKRHLVYADYDIWTKRKTLFNYRATGYEFALPNEDFTAGFFPPCSTFVFDETEKYYNSRGSNLSDYVCRAFELHGHLEYDFFLVTHRTKIIDLNIRDLSPRILEVVSLKHRYKYGVIASSVWTCKQYDSAQDAIDAVEGKKSYYKTVRFKFVGNIFKHYESHGFESLFLNGREKKDFSYEMASNYECTVEGVKRFNETHGYTPPKGYFKKGGKKSA